MKGIYGLLVALALGLAGAVVNFAYLGSKLKDVEKWSYIGVRKGSHIERGQTLREEDLEKIELPQAWVGSLDDVADRWDVLKTVVLGKPVARTLNGPRLLLRDDYRNAPNEMLVLAANETARFVTVDSRSFVPSLLMPGAKVRFLVPAVVGPTRAVVPPPETTPGGEPSLEPVSSQPKVLAGETSDSIGPFVVLAVGNRLATPDVWKAHRMPQMQENVLTIRVDTTKPEEVERADRLFKRLQAIEFRPVSLQIVEQGAVQVGTGP